MATTLNPTAGSYKSPFIIYNRNNKLASSDLPVFNNTEDLRNCFIFDKDNRSILACTVDKTDTGSIIANFEQLSGHVLYNSIVNNSNTDSTTNNLNIVGQHGERFNDYENNLPIGIYSFTAGFNTIALNQFESAFGIYNESIKGSNQLFSIGNGRSKSSRRNIFTVYNDRIIINSPLTIYGSVTADNIKDVDLSLLKVTINNQSEQISQLVSKNKELEELNEQQAERITDCENTIQKLIDSLNTITERLSDKVLLYIDDNSTINNNPSDNTYGTNAYVTDSVGNYVQYTDKINNKTSFVVS